MVARQGKTGFDHVDTWIFDLDNTLYPATSELFGQVERRINDYVAEYLKLERAEAFRVQKQYFLQHGTTLRGLMVCHDMDPDPYLEYVHDVNLSAIPESPSLAAALGRLTGRKIIFTNATTPYAQKIMTRLGVGDHFGAVFDIADAGYLPKPAPEVYDRLINQHDIDPKHSVLVDDLPRNLEPAAALGMTTVWMRTGLSWGQEGADGDFIHHIIEDLPAWLNTIAPPPKV
jgi:putative hydrolase of the HAD superfamily